MVWRPFFAGRSAFELCAFERCGSAFRALQRSAVALTLIGVAAPFLCSESRVFAADVFAVDPPATSPSTSATKESADAPTTTTPAAPSAPAAPAENKPESSDAKPEQSSSAPLLSLAYVPAETVGLFALRPQGFFGREELKLLDRLLNVNGNDFRNPIPITKVEQFTMVVVRPEPERPPLENGARLIFDIVLIRSSEPVDWDKKRAAFPYEMREAEHAGKRYYKIPEHPNFCFYPADDRNYVVSDEWNLKRVMEQAPGDASKLAWCDVWPTVATSSCAFAFEPAWAAAQMKEGRQIPGLEQLMKDAKSFSATLDGGSGMRFRLLVDCPDEKIADSKVQGAKAMIGLARLAMKPKSDANPPPDGKKAPRTFNDLTGPLLASAEFSQAGRTAIVTMNSDADIGMAMQVITTAVGQLFGSRVANQSGQFQFSRTTETAPAAVPSGVANTPAMLKRRGISKQNLESVAAALRKYQERTKTLPARASMSTDGKPLLSWRVQILPDLGYDDLYREFHLDEAWDSEHNAKLVAKMPREFGGPLAAGAKPPNGNTLVMAMVGPMTCFPEQGTKTLSEIVDDASTTLLVTETRRNTPWTKPDDLLVDPSGKLSGRLGGVHPGGVVFCTVDGKAHFVRDATLATIVPALFTVAGQDPIDAKHLNEDERQ